MPNHKIASRQSILFICKQQSQINNWHFIFSVWGRPARYSFLSRFVFGISYSTSYVLSEAFCRTLLECLNNIFLAVAVLFCELIKSKFLLNPFQPSIAFHIETSHLFNKVKQVTGFYIKRNAGQELFNLILCLLFYKHA